jgi:hypothetical protein
LTQRKTVEVGFKAGTYIKEVVIFSEQHHLFTVDFTEVDVDDETLVAHAQSDRVYGDLDIEVRDSNFVVTRYILTGHFIFRKAKDFAAVPFLDKLKARFKESNLYTSVDGGGYCDVP